MTKKVWDLIDKLIHGVGVTGKNFWALGEVDHYSTVSSWFFTSKIIKMTLHCNDPPLPERWNFYQTLPIEHISAYPKDFRGGHKLLIFDFFGH